MLWSLASYQSRRTYSRHDMRLCVFVARTRPDRSEQCNAMQNMIHGRMDPAHTYADAGYVPTCATLDSQFVWLASLACRCSLAGQGRAGQRWALSGRPRSLEWMHRWGALSLLRCAWHAITARPRSAVYIRLFLSLSRARESSRILRMFAASCSTWLM